MTSSNVRSKFAPIRRFIALFGLISLLHLASASDNWNNGKCLHYEQQTFTTYSQVNGTGDETPHTTYRLQIEANNRIYFVERTLNWRWQKFPRVTENGPIEWHLKGKNEMIIRDDNGKEFTVDIVKTRIPDSN